MLFAVAVFVVGALCGAIAVSLYREPWGDMHYCRHGGCFAVVGREHDECYHHR